MTVHDTTTRSDGRHQSGAVGREIRATARTTPTRRLRPAAPSIAAVLSVEEIREVLLRAVQG
jgi:hypothetical protein